MAPCDGLEWLEADGLGGFASGTASGVRTRRYHALLCSAARPPADRRVLVNGFDAFIETDAGTFPISTQRYAPGVLHPEGYRTLTRFEPHPWPRWTHLLPDGTEVVQELFVPHGRAACALTWRASRPATARVRLFFSGRDYHALHHENAAFDFVPRREGEALVWQPYPGLSPVRVLASGTYRHGPQWYRNFLYEEERGRGLDHREDLASPGELELPIGPERPGVVLLAASDLPRSGAHAELDAWREREQRRRAGFASPLHRAADAYVVGRGEGKTLVAGYPWFTDWGRDTFIALRGLCIATGRFDDARDILLEWAGAVSEGMLPNRFADGSDDPPEYNSVDAALWFVVAAHELCQRAPLRTSDRGALEGAIDAILTGYAAGTRHGIRADSDGLLAAGAPGVQLTWMDAKIGDWVVTPRIGKPVEVQALWLNALRIGAPRSPRWGALYARGLASFRARFWNEATGSLHDVVDVAHVPGTFDATFRPNQIFAVGGLPFPLVDGERARRLVLAVEARLWTPLGLRSLAREDAAYAPRYVGDARARDAVYHQGTVWPWLAGPFVEAWVRVHGGRDEHRREARARYFDALLAHLADAGLGHVSEIADADPPHTPRGCPFQAWSVGELLRLDRVVLGDA